VELVTDATSNSPRQVVCCVCVGIYFGPKLDAHKDQGSPYGQAYYIVSLTRLVSGSSQAPHKTMDARWRRATLFGMLFLREVND